MKYVKIWTRRPYPPVLMVLVARATVDGFSKVFESKITKVGNYWENGENTYFYPKAQLDGTVSKLSKKGLKSPEFIFRFFKKAYEKSSQLNKFSEKYLGKELVKLPTKELLDFHREFIARFYEMYCYGTVPILVGYSQDNPIYEKANQILMKKTKDSPAKFADYMIALTNPPQKLMTVNQEFEVLKIAKKAKKQGVKSKKEIINKFEKELEKLFANYGWLSYDLRNELTWDIDHYAKSIFDKLNTDIDKRIKFIVDYEKSVKKDFEKAVAELKLNKKEVEAFDIIRNMGYYKWAREHEFVKALYNLKFVRDELGRRAGLSPLGATYLLTEEFDILFDGPKKFKAIVKQRQKNYLAFCTPGNKTKSYLGQEAAKKFNKLEFESIEDKVEKKAKIKGIPACAGKVKGVVKIVSVVGHIGKMKEGNILVSVATNPDLLPAMKKASAIITDEGGITCHAAIVSRELNIPCVVGTKIATKTLKDGDRVEVDADKGIVKMLSK